MSSCSGVIVVKTLTDCNNLQDFYLSPACSDSTEMKYTDKYLHTGTFDPHDYLQAVNTSMCPFSGEFS